MGESNWNFSKGETDIKDFRKSEIGLGLAYACSSFSPSEVSFIIKYNYPSSSKFPINVIADKKGKVAQDKVRHIITVIKATSLEIQLPAKGIYEITNTTGAAIESNQYQCEGSDYG